MIILTNNPLLALICTLCAGLTAPAWAADTEEIVPRRASDYLTYYAVYALTAPGGAVIIEFEVEGTGRIDFVGASYIVVQEKVGTKWIGATYFGSTSNGMPAGNDYFHIGSITYKGTPGKEYRALATVYAENSSGNDSRTIITNSVTAK